MKRIFVSIISSVLLISCSARESTINKVENSTNTKPQDTAWNGTSWGMPFEQVNNIFKNQLERSELVFCEEPIRDKCNAFELKKYLIGKENYDVKFTFIDNKLAIVELNCESESGSSEIYRAGNCLDNIKYFLVQKYGTPIKDEQTKETFDSEYSITTTNYRKHEIEWTLPEKNIGLYYDTCNGECGNNKFSRSSLNIVYSPTDRFKINTDYESEKNKI